MEKIVPQVGMGATAIVGSDRYPYTIVRVRSDKTIVVQEDKATIVKGHGNDGSAEYEYERNENGTVKTLRYSAQRRLWFELGSPHSIFSIGSRRKYHDPSF